MMGKRKRIGLALGGGGARGMAHIGVLKVLDAETIPIDIIAGTSIGALVGAAYSSGLAPSELEEMIESFLDSSTFQNSALKSMKEFQDRKKLSFTQKIQGFFKNQILLFQAMFKPGMLDTEDFQAMIDFFLPDIQIEDTRVPFRAVATDLVSGQALVMSQGSLRRAVMASCAVPGAVPPLNEGGMFLSDGGIINMVPASVVREEGAEFVVAVSVNGDINEGEDFKSVMDIYVRAHEIMSYHLENLKLEEADVSIRPDVGSLHWTDFVLAEDLIEEGERAAKEKLHDLRKALPLAKRWAVLSFLNRLL
ncbi:MAG: patatin-like phospholipase family protein [Desulfatiglans sp.]|jgi:NTE family protein|nr:patatin-like phospholipase family protein [Thermodesulfobacteriota bacterium]MEE4354047.1 patatin-like phospholipase family protein [Desulfatiglans sp.]